MSSLIKDLKITIKSCKLVQPLETHERRSMFLSNIDQVLNFNVERVHFFDANLDFNIECVADKLEFAFRTLLSSYDFIAGRLNFNTQEKRLEIDCNAAGAVFVVAESELTIAEIGDLEYPNPAFAQLVVKIECMEAEDKPLCAIQVTSFKCGAIAMGTTNNHTTMDGVSFKVFFESLASLVSGKPLGFTPISDRRSFAARSPPRVEFTHPELTQILKDHHQTDQTLIDSTSSNLEFKLYQLSQKDINNLKGKARNQGKEGPWITTFNVVTALVWICKALATTSKDKTDKISMIFYAVDLRSRLQPPLPNSYTGNAVLTAYAKATYDQLENEPFGFIVELLHQGVARLTEEYARSVIDWGELHKGYPKGDIFVSSWLKLGTMEVEFPWGRPKYNGPVVHPNKDIILLTPQMKGKKKECGVNAILALPPRDIPHFETLFHKLLLI
ncbi:omega-hydroxypalmitate O-feruloyl transferase-like [Dioscorea cayenensis subsp. rotundata]|uniref:Omega-hydroxypalmitate O-feruloyl transferase-like n=1 Tax=Dioscorea cayennensis subsp. rotundata TaxID=55577 RepID=A0AB40C1Z3_DIOCR|nr:omega-hydroxypalmitate O-feruloyl transferase-like [Dioscorea cayenensis subsp. rotundata]